MTQTHGISDIVHTHNITPVLQTDQTCRGTTEYKKDKAKYNRTVAIPSVVSQATPPTKIFLSKKKKLGLSSVSPPISHRLLIGPTIRIQPNRLTLGLKSNTLQQNLRNTKS